MDASLYVFTMHGCKYIFGVQLLPVHKFKFKCTSVHVTAACRAMAHEGPYGIQSMQAISISWIGSRQCCEWRSVHFCFMPAYPWPTYTHMHSYTTCSWKDPILGLLQVFVKQNFIGGARLVGLPGGLATVLGGFLAVKMWPSWSDGWQASEVRVWSNIWRCWNC